MVFTKLFGAVGTHLHADYRRLSASLRMRLVFVFGPGIRGWIIVHDCPVSCRVVRRIHDVVEQKLAERWRPPGERVLPHWYMYLGLYPFR